MSSQRRPSRRALGEVFLHINYPSFEFLFKSIISPYKRSLNLRSDCANYADSAGYRLRRVLRRVLRHVLRRVLCPVLHYVPR